jgi:CheY-like chemotaxis protein
VETKKYRVIVTPADLVPGHVAIPMLRRSSFEVRAVDSAQDVLGIASSWLPHLVVFSSVMSGMPVTEFCTRVRAMSQLRETRLLMITELLGADETEQIPAKIDAHVVNPVDDGQLDEIVGELLSIRRRQAPRAAVDLLARIDSLGDGGTMAANLLDISESGGRLEAPGFLEVGVTGTIRFVLPDTSEMLSLGCIVRVAIDEVLLHYGVEFIDLTHEQRTSLAEFVARRKKGDRA